jgi:hypothetical protein
MAKLLRRLSDMEKKMELMDFMMWLAIALAGIYSVWALYLTYVSIAS